MTEERFFEIQDEFYKKKALEDAIGKVKEILKEWKTKIITLNSFFYHQWREGEKENMMLIIEKHLEAMQNDLTSELQKQFEEQSEKFASI